MHGDPGPSNLRVVAAQVGLATVLLDSTLSACIPALIEAAEHHVEVSAFLHTYNAERLPQLIDTIQRGIDDGELPAHLDAELAALALIGPIIYRRTMIPQPLAPRRVRQLVDIVLGAAQRPRGQGRG